jgi:hypothetical protein
MASLDSLKYRWARPALPLYALRAATPETTINGRFRGDRPQGGQPAPVLRLPRIPHATLACIPAFLHSCIPAFLHSCIPPSAVESLHIPGPRVPDPTS